MNTAELRELSVAELREKLQATRTELWKKRNALASGQLQKTAEIPALRKRVARALTLIAEKKRGSES